MDVLGYTYVGNQLQKVDDSSGNEKGFKDGNTTGDDYAYDENGNLTVDLNKGIDHISYNHLNLPDSVHKSTGEYTKYIYSAWGNKLTQETYNTNDVLQKRTDYIGEFIYESEGSNPSELTIIQHEEGRIVPNSVTGGWEYQYHLKDHLGNTRLMFTTKPKTHTFTLNYESDPNNTDDESLFENVNISAIADFNSTAGTYQDATPYAHSQILYSSPNSQAGSILAIPVGKGDKVTATVKAKYFTALANATVPTGGIVSSLLSAFTAGTGGTSENGTSTINSNFGSGDLIGTTGFPYDANAPQAFLNVMFLPNNKSINLVKDATFAYDQIADGSSESNIDGISTSPYDELKVENFEAAQSGYILIYVSNEGSLVDVHFDDMRITVNESKVIQTDSYYPFGLAFNSWQRSTGKENKFLFGGKEIQNDLDLGWMDFHARQYDPVIGRMLSVDPMTELTTDWTPYRFGFNNPIRYTDPTGMSEVDENGNITITDTEEIGYFMAGLKKAYGTGDDSSEDDGEGDCEGKDCDKKQNKNGELSLGGTKKSDLSGLHNFMNNVTSASMGAIAAGGAKNMLDQMKVNFIPIFDETGTKVIGMIPKGKGAIAYTSVRYVKGAFEFLGPAGDAVLTIYNTNEMAQGNMSKGRYTYNLIGTGGGLYATYAFGGPAGAAVGFAAMFGDAVYDTYETAKNSPDPRVRTTRWYEFGKQWNRIKGIFSGTLPGN